jgi:hypothetical protein
MIKRRNPNPSRFRATLIGNLLSLWNNQAIQFQSYFAGDELREKCIAQGGESTGLFGCLTCTDKQWFYETTE